MRWTTSERCDSDTTYTQQLVKAAAVPERAIPLTHSAHQASTEPQQKLEHPLPPQRRDTWIIPESRLSRQNGVRNQPWHIPIALLRGHGRHLPSLILTSSSHNPDAIQHPYAKRWPLLKLTQKYKSTKRAKSTEREFTKQIRSAHGAGDVIARRIPDDANDDEQTAAWCPGHSYQKASSSSIARIS